MRLANLAYVQSLANKLEALHKLASKVNGQYQSIGLRFYVSGGAPEIVIQREDHSELISELFRQEKLRLENALLDAGVELA